MRVHRIAVVALATLFFALPSARALAAKSKPTPAPSKAEAAARELLQGCEQREISDGVLFQCERLITAIAEKPGAPDALRDSLLALVRSLGGELNVSSAAITIGNKVLPGSAFELVSPGTKDTSHLAGEVVAFEQRPGVARAVLCFSSKPTETSEYTCKKLFNALGAVGPTPFLATEPKPDAPEFLGRKIGVPDGCRTIAADATSFRVDCGGMASVYYAKARSIEVAKSIEDAFLENALKGGRAAPDRPCFVGGVQTTCKVIDVPRLTFYLGAVAVGRQAIIAICGQEPDRVAVNPVCADVFSF